MLFNTSQWFDVPKSWKKLKFNLVSVYFEMHENTIENYGSVHLKFLHRVSSTVIFDKSQNRLAWGKVAHSLKTENGTKNTLY